MPVRLRLLGALTVAAGLVLATGPTAVVRAATRSALDAPAPSWCHGAAPVLDETFAGAHLDRAVWNTFVTSKGGGGTAWFPDGHGGSEIDPTNYLDYDRPSQVHVHDGLDLVAVRHSTRPGFPWTSGIVTTYGHVEIDGGCVVVRAKMPTAGGAWPAIWLLPGSRARTSTDNFEIDVFEGGMRPGHGAPETGSYALHHGARRQWDGTYGTGVDLSSGYHLFGIDWVPGRSVTWYFDGRAVARVTSARFPIPNEPMELLLNNGVARATIASWHTTASATTPASMTMAISSVQIYR